MIIENLEINRSFWGLSALINENLSAIKGSIRILIMETLHKDG